MNLRPLLASTEVDSARERIRALDDETVAEQITIAQIAAPPFHEDERGRYLRTRLAEIGLDRIATDEAGNVLGWLPHRGAAAAEAPVLLTAHIDTVFAPDTPLNVRREGERIRIPGIADNARGLAALLTLARVLLESSLRLRRPLLLVGTVGEEGAGDLRGVKHLFRMGSPLRATNAFVSLDGCGVRRIVHRAVGSRRLKVRISGPGGHSWADWGTANPLNVAGRAIASLAELELPNAPRATLTVARAAGGTSINAIPAEAWLELDVRSEASESLEQVVAEARKSVADALDAENRRRRRRTVALRSVWETIGERPAGSVPARSHVVRAAVAATRALGIRPELAASSTDANLPISLGIPSVTVGAGGESGGIHTLDEWYTNQAGAVGVERALLLVLALSGVANA